MGGPARVFHDAAGLPAALAPERHPSSVLVCPPDHFDVRDVKNVHMRGRAGEVDRERAREQWEALVAAFREAGLAVERIQARPDLEDMVFAANQTLTGLDSEGRRVCLLSRMHHESRRREVPFYAEWFRARGYEVLDAVPEGERFEGGGDALWHPGRRLLWTGHGHRSSPGAHEAVARSFGCPVVSLELPDERFYHLDTCLCPIDERTALVFPGAFTASGIAAIRGLFERVVEADEEEAVSAFACNAAAFHGTTVVVDLRAVRTIARLRSLGYRVLPVDTGEFLKSGGSVFCLKQLLW